MKKHLLSFCFMGLLFSAQAQVNSYLLNNPVWELSSSCAVPAPCIQDEDYNYYTHGDTVINTLTYKLIFRQGQGSYSWMAPPPPMPGCGGTYWYIDTFPRFFLRSAGKQMYLRFPSDTNEYFLYDFNLTIGDSLPISYTNFDNGVTVTAIDSFYTPHGYRKRFTLSGNTWSQYLLEGVGHSRGLIEPMQVPLECGYALECYSMNDTSYYPALGPTCNLMVGQAEILSAFSLEIYPNPFSGHTTLWTREHLLNATLTVNNCFGHTVMQLKNINGQTVVLNRDNLATGLYFVRLTQDNRIIATNKLIITD